MFSFHRNNLNLSRCVRGLNSAGGDRIIAPVLRDPVQLCPNTSAHSRRHLLHRTNGGLNLDFYIVVTQYVYVNLRSFIRSSSKFIPTNWE